MPRDALAFVDGVLAASCRHEVAQAAVKSKLRGKRLLLESARTVAPGEAVRRQSKAGQRHPFTYSRRPNIKSCYVGDVTQKLLHRTHGCTVVDFTSGATPDIHIVQP